MNRNINIALLIDADNAQPAATEKILLEASKYGNITIKRIYGDFTRQVMQIWHAKIDEFSLVPMHSFTYTVGKNATDIAMAIDAMDILHSKKVQGFCIVSSDSDFTGLAKRLKEDGMFVMGVGKNITPKAFINSCSVFTFTEGLLNISSQEEYLKIIDEAYQNAKKREDGLVYVSHIGIEIRKIDPNFDVRCFGVKTLATLMEKLENYDLINNEVDGLNHPLVKLKLK